MTTLQEAVKKFIEATKLDRIEFEDWPRDSQTAFESLRTALAQQGKQQPVAWYEYNQDLNAWFLAYGHNPKAKTRPLVFGDTAAPAPQAQGKSDNYLSGYCTGRTDLLKEQSAQPVAQPLTLEQLLGIVKKLGVTPDMSHVDVFKTFARAIESAHGIREVK